MGCLSNVIGILNGCNSETATSGLYLDHINITLNEVEKLVSGDYASGSVFVQQKIDFAAIEMARMINAHFKGVFNAKTLLENAKLGYPSENMISVPGSTNVLRGIKIDFVRQTSRVKIELSSVSLFVDTAGTYNVLVYDLYQNKLLDTIEVVAQANKITKVVLNKSYQATNQPLSLAIIYDTSSTGSYETLINGSGCGTCGNNTYSYSNSYISVNQIECSSSDSKIAENMNSSSSTGGLMVEYSISCDHDAWLCSIQNLIALPMLYNVAAMIMDYGINATNRQNTKTIVDTEKLKERREYYMLRYRESLDESLANILIPNDPICFQCRDLVMTRISLP